MCNMQVVKQDYKPREKKKKLQLFCEHMHSLQPSGEVYWLNNNSYI